MPDLLWTPHPDAINEAEISVFARSFHGATGADWQEDYGKLWQYSVDQPEAFWSHLWDWHGVLGTKGDVLLRDPDQMTGGAVLSERQAELRGKHAYTCR
jgi:acetoacetyl-CoA synthetase